MDLRETVGDREQLVRTLLAVGLSVVAISSLRKGRRLNGLLAGGGALALGYTATTGSGKLDELDSVEDELGELTETLDVGTTDEDTKLRCAACGESIDPGETRGPNENDEIVHLDCK